MLGNLAPQDEAMDQSTSQRGGAKEADDIARASVGQRRLWAWRHGWLTLSTAGRYARLTFVALTTPSWYAGLTLGLLRLTWQGDPAMGGRDILQIGAVHRDTDCMASSCIGQRVGCTCSGVAGIDRALVFAIEAKDVARDSRVAGTGGGSEPVSIVAVTHGIEAEVLTQ